MAKIIITIISNDVTNRGIKIGECAIVWGFNIASSVQVAARNVHWLVHAVLPPTTRCWHLIGLHTSRDHVTANQK